MMPSIGVAVLLGAGVFLVVRALLDAANQEASALLHRQMARRTQVVIASIAEMIARRDQPVAAGAEQADRRSTGIWLAILDARRRALQQILACRRAMAETIVNYPAACAGVSPVIE